MIATKYWGIGPVPIDVWRRELVRVNSPLMTYVEAMHTVAGQHSALCLAMMWSENQYATTGIIIKPTDFNPLSLRPWEKDPRGLPVGATGIITGPDGGRFLKFSEPQHCVAEWRRRLFDDPAYKGGVYTKATSLESMLAIYAPAGDVHPVTGLDNADSGYVTTVLTMLNKYAKMINGEEPMASIKITKKMIPSSNKNYPDQLLNAAGGLWVTVHETGNTNPGASAASEANFSVESQGGDSGVSYHFAVDHLGAYQMLALNRVGWHAGDGCNSRSADLGCFASVAIETVVGDGNKHKVATRANLITLIAMILRGDPAIDFGGTDPTRFSPERLAPHKKWSSYSKQCPKYMLDEDYFPKIKPAVISALAGSVIPTPVPVKPLLVYPAGLDRAIATGLFGSARGSDGVMYGFDESGSISKLWLEHGKKVQRFPRLSAVQMYKDSETAYRKYFIFADGLIIWHTDKIRAAVLAAPIAA